MQKERISRQTWSRKAKVRRMFETEFSFVLPKGYMDRDGNLHKEGKMRLATAADEIIPLRDPRVQQNPGYLVIILLSRVITSLGTMPAVDTKVIEGLYTPDLAYLQDLYERVNQAEVSCVPPNCCCVRTARWSASAALKRLPIILLRSILPACFERRIAGHAIGKG